MTRDGVMWATTTQRCTPLTSTNSPIVVLCSPTTMSWLNAHPPGLPFSQAGTQAELVAVPLLPAPSLPSPRAHQRSHRCYSLKDTIPAYQENGTWVVLLIMAPIILDLIKAMAAFRERLGIITTATVKVLSFTPGIAIIN